MIQITVKHQLSRQIVVEKTTYSNRVLYNFVQSWNTPNTTIYVKRNGYLVESFIL